MIWIFNRKEAAVTNSMEQQARWRAAFSKAGVEYDVKVTDRTSPSVISDTRARTGSFGQPAGFAKEYRFFVRKQDLETAKQIISRNH
ncbi:hypothetical protein [Massiliimalia timonensis]|uniref:hypothetical protein n=1 Tax=Massiliimalia timonensis TaxID=1987501 RepID=UPI00189F3251|nr:hypothetical protein [Massiliimalia timonensis]